LLTLVIMDGVGLSDIHKGNAEFNAKKPNLDYYMANYPNTTLKASGLAVGLPEGQQGNSEVGHTNIGAGRVCYQDLTLINKAIEDGDFFENKALLEAINYAKDNNSDLHLMGMVSDGGVHSHQDHLYAILKLAKMQNFNRVYIHAFLDGRDVPAHSAKGYLKQLEDKIKEIGVGKIATISGRFYAMDRDTSWPKIEKAYDAIVHGEGPSTTDIYKTLDDAYANGMLIDELLEPTVVLENNQPIVIVKDNDSVIHFNFRKDRARQLSQALYFKDFDGFQRTPPKIFYCTMTDFDDRLNSHVAFAQSIFNNHLGEVLSKKGLKNLRIAETEKYAHITFYLNAMFDIQYEGEDRILIPSKKVTKLFDEAPKMSAEEIRDTAVENIKSGKYDAVFINFANGDLVGHSGIYDAAVIAVETVDQCVGDVVSATLEQGGNVILTADHGNCEQMKYPNGDICTSHTTNPVPFIVIGNDVSNIKLKEGGILGDIASTVLELMDIEKPEEMTGKSLIVQ